MKKIILLLVLITPIVVRAQVTQGNVFLGGTVDFQSTKVTGGSLSHNVYSISPQIGYMFTNQDAFGGGVSIGGDNQVDDGDGGSLDQKTFGFNLFYRHYFPITETFFFVIHPQFDFQSGKQTENGFTLNTTALALQVMPRFVFFPSKHWSFEAGVGSVGFEKDTQKFEDNKVTTNIFALNAGTVNLGVFYYFNK